MEKIIKCLDLDMTKNELKEKIKTVSVENTEILSVEVTDKDKKMSCRNSKYNCKSPSGRNIACS